MAGERLRFGVLGPLLVERDGQDVGLPRSRVVRGLLGVLLLAAGAPLAVERLAELVWEVRAGRIGRGAVQVGVSRLRNWLHRAELDETAIVDHGSAGYRLTVPPTAVDLSLFYDRVGRAEQAEDPATRCGLLSSALGLLRGPVLADLPGLDAADALLVSVRAAVRAAAVALGTAALEAGHAEAAAAPLEALADAHPLDEPMHARLIEVLAACGRPSEALRRYELLREHLAEELGVAPSEEVQRAHLAVLVRDRDLGGMPIGTTTLAVRVAHRLRDQGHDGRSYVDLGGSRAADPAEVLDWLLWVLGLHGAAIPAGLEGRSGLYRSVLAGRRVLVVLDNAASETSCCRCCRAIRPVAGR